MTDFARIQGYVHLGDGVYCRFDGYNVWIETTRENDERHLVALEPETICNLVQYISELRKRFPTQPVPAWEALRRSVRREELRNDLPRHE